MTTKSYVLAGKATFSIKSERTGDHLSFKVRKHKVDDVHFVNSNSGGNWDLIGVIREGKHFFASKKNTDQRKALAFDWFWKKIENLPSTCSLHKSTKCCRCGRELTDPQSIEAGIGPECSSYQ